MAMKNIMKPIHLFSIIAVIFFSPTRLQLDSKTEKFVDFGIDIPAGKGYLFKEPVADFSIRGIEMETKVDPSYGIAFPTGVAFAEDADFVKMRMISVTADTEQEKL